jgi:hypothetical protein
MVDAFAICGATYELGPLVRKRWGDLVQRVSIDTPDPKVLEALHAD